MLNLFFSYSHRDETLRDELEIHLSTLKRQGVIAPWHDRRIDAGSEFDASINQNLEIADVILLLVSPYFLASNYCYEIEMRRAIERHDNGQARVIPVILEPCDWQGTPFSKLLAVPKDGKPISKFPNQHDGFMEVVHAIRQAASNTPDDSGGLPVAMNKSLIGKSAVTKNEIRSSNLRVRKEFTDSVRDSFLESSFEYIAKFFEGSLGELTQRNSEIEGKYRRIDATSFCAFIYRNGASATECRISLSSMFHRSNEILFSHDTRQSNSFNEALSVGDDGHSLFLTSMGMSSFGQSREQLTQQGAAELFWSLLIRPLQ